MVGEVSTAVNARVSAVTRGQVRLKSFDHDAVSKQANRPLLSLRLARRRRQCRRRRPRRSPLIKYRRDAFLP